MIETGSVEKAPPANAPRDTALPDATGREPASLIQPGRKEVDRRRGRAAILGLAQLHRRGAPMPNDDPRALRHVALDTDSV